MAIFVFVSPASAVSLAPVSERFAAYVEEENAAAARRVGANERRGGYMPSPVDMSHIDAAGVLDALGGNKRAARAYYPSKFDLRDYYGINIITPVKDQGDTEACWAFASLAALESNYLRQTNLQSFGQTVNLSAMHMAYFAYRDNVSFGMGYPSRSVMSQMGNSQMAVALLSRMTGAVRDELCPFGEGTSVDYPAKASPAFPNRLMLTEAVLLFDAPRSHNMTRESIKYALSNYGGVSIAYSSSNEALYYNDEHAARYCRYAASANHQVLIVGWDDDFPRENFNEDHRPPSNGAWLVKNSWGTDYGQDGYFWLSYQDGSIREGTFFRAAPASLYSNVYAHDPLGWCGSIGYESNKAYMANVFDAKSAGEKLAAVSFFTNATNTDYIVEVYTNVAVGGGPRDGMLEPSATTIGTVNSPGYHLLSLRNTVSLIRGQRFSIVVRLLNRPESDGKTYDYPIPIEYPVPYQIMPQRPNYSAEARAYAGQSYISSDDKTWQDITTLTVSVDYSTTDIEVAMPVSLDRANVCIKGYVKGGTAYPSEPSNDKYVVPDDDEDTSEKKENQCGTGVGSIALLLAPTGCFYLRRR